MTSNLLLLMLLFSSQLVDSTMIRCYKGLKYFVGQDIYQDTEDCDNILGLGESYCYTFYEESSVQSVTKMGCSSIVCNAIRNLCAESSLGNMNGKLCCCNDRHYCNGAGPARLVPVLVPLLFILSAIEVILYLP